MSRKSFMEGPWTELSRNEDEAKAIDVMRGHWQPPSRAALYSQYRSLSNGRESAPLVCWTIHKAQGFIPGKFTDAGLSIGCNKDMYSINCQHPMRRLQYRCAEQRGTAAATCWLETRGTSRVYKRKRCAMLLRRTWTLRSSSAPRDIFALSFMLKLFPLGP
jgi:hypothetical protein